MTDLDKLHNVIEKRSSGLPRRAGKTYARCHELAGHVEVGDFRNIIVGMTHYSDVDYLFPMIEDIFNEHRIELKRISQNVFQANGKRILFMSSSQMSNKTRGLEYFYQPMGHLD